MLPFVIVDPSVLWVSDENDTEEQFSLALEHSMGWLQRPSSHGLQVFVHQRGIERLAELGLIPIEPFLRGVLSRFNLEGVVSAAELSGMINRAIATGDSIEDFLNVKDALFSNIDIHPDIFSVISNEELRALSRDTLAITSLNQHQSNRGYIYAFPRQAVSAASVKTTIAATIPDSIFDHEDTLENIIIVDGVSSIDKNLNALDIWVNSTKDTELAIAMRVLANELCEKSTIPLQFRIGSNFLLSIQKNGGLNGPHAQQILTKCAQVLAHTPNLEIGDFRTTEDTTSSIRTRQIDGAQAKRIHLSKSHEAMRLLLWQCPDGVIEFANIGPKKELWIAP